MTNFAQVGRPALMEIDDENFGNLYDDHAEETILRYGDV